MEVATTLKRIGTSRGFIIPARILKKYHIMDILIAATAIRESVTLLTENAKHFSRIPNLQTECWR